MKMSLELYGRSKKELFVYVCEEYGYRHWAWFPKMTPEELESWWRNLPTVNPYFMTPVDLPGEMVQITDLYSLMPVMEDIHNNSYSCHIHMDEDSYLRTPEGENIRHQGAKEWGWEERR